uniref:Uncharacterized protein n=1 Tax=Chromera velia CCMP2878 TaxID=1169474 RepID=A0A0G4IEA9_9ALVE|eukprot:Cvel_13622.t1-p1 / transcript=Cvel_13622.t1 / gene=Cvel_13622 / organism=Chromera_velia_CCMP2878 / gene_product=hypothetical protein / transcript_product=hypothetical protein / location=Cvel_scaffold938:30844-32327(-) / protein_length=449 / sequence_SO=supercontig / SO=protein_coding / is_pseudo=false
MPPVSSSDEINSVLGDASFLQKFGRAPRAEDAEVLRIRTHLQYVTERLKKSPEDGSRLSTDQLGKRQAMIKHLEAYTERGFFPRNTEMPKRNPIFIDQEGRPCAVAFLMQKSENEAMAARVDALAHSQKVLQMASDERVKGDLSRFASDNGLTIDELAMIQPGYAPDPAAMLVYGVGYAVMLFLELIAVLFIFTTLEITGVIPETPPDPQMLQSARDSPHLSVFVWMASESGTAVILPSLALLCPLGVFCTFWLLCWIVRTHNIPASDECRFFHPQPYNPGRGIITDHRSDCCQKALLNLSSTLAIILAVVFVIQSVSSLAFPQLPVNGFLYLWDVLWAISLVTLIFSYSSALYFCFDAQNRIKKAKENAAEGETQLLTANETLNQANIPVPVHAHPPGYTYTAPMTHFPGTVMMPVESSVGPSGFVPQAQPGIAYVPYVPGQGFPPGQ